LTLKKIIYYDNSIKKITPEHKKIENISLFYTLKD